MAIRIGDRVFVSSNHKHEAMPPDRLDNPGVVRDINGGEGSITYALVEFDNKINGGHNGTRLEGDSFQCWWIQVRSLSRLDGDIDTNNDSLF